MKRYSLRLTEYRYVYYRSIGCDACGGSGYSERISLYELMPVSDEMEF